ncbi:Lrp/AsnC family transcriptional regulator [Solirubrobacter sp. CPCC 204708]|uniref:Lrp/AsnC family transcriptional regulator n=1 Tax=Solirubrobacter deserti TaxID=2282478 RepID=A0ABT4RIS4_9ACTN|nr:Lrp/AsnC family transcriptional regulator [Solirubrobacter deserti]MBE2320811.1 Lrp/AsnC family transcriptional regulator [Solirubrobacter deserti]MDA0138446.1 Lrp/AsnC family transcriptional regulator [Solirubrobacter deserti]
MVSAVSGEIDNHIIRELVRNGRAPFAQIAQEVGLSAHAVAERVRRLEARGVIRGYTALIDQGELGRSLGAYIDVRLAPTTDPDTFERLARSLPATRSIAFVTGRFDYIVQLACEDAADLDQTVRELRSRGGVAATETRIVMRTIEVPR